MTDGEQASLLGRSINGATEPKKKELFHDEKLLCTDLKIGLSVSLTIMRAFYDCPKKWEKNQTKCLWSKKMGFPMKLLHNFQGWIVLFKITRSFAALRAADLDWIVGPGYSLQPTAYKTQS